VVKDVPKHFGDGPQWNRRGEGNGDEGRKKVMATDQSIANCGPVTIGKHPNQNMTHDEMDHNMMYITYSNSLTPMIMLTLDPTTLFYWTISDPPPKKMKYSVKFWAKSIPSNAKPASRAPSQANSAKMGKSSSTNRYGSTAPALTNKCYFLFCCLLHSHQCHHHHQCSCSCEDQTRSRFHLYI
jgi:hypothetical protein